MKFELPGQLRGKDAGRVMPVAIKIRKELEGHFSDLGEERIRRISPVLRIGGDLGSFGEDSVANLKTESKESECEIVIAPRDWNQMTELEIYHLLKPKVMKAIELLMIDSGFDTLPPFLTTAQNQTVRDNG